MRASIAFLLLANFFLTSADLFADNATPVVKIEVEVIVFEDGNVTVQGMPARKMSLAKTEEKAKSGTCCNASACSKCSDAQKSSVAKKEDKMMTKKSPSKKPGAKSMAKKVADNIMKLDKNGDSRLNADEVQPRLRTPFSDVDANGDGYLDRGEVIRQIKQKMRAS